MSDVEIAWPKRRLIVGAINYYEPERGWENFHMDISDRGLNRDGVMVQPDLVHDARQPFSRLLPVPFDEIKCHDMLEHVNRDEAHMVLLNFYGILRMGGILDIQVPDFQGIVNEWVIGDAEKHKHLLQVVYGDQTPMEGHSHNEHRWGYTERSLIDLLVKFKFQPGDRIPGDLHFRATKFA